jgi:hypothetical protein
MIWVGATRAGVWVAFTVTEHLLERTLDDSMMLHGQLGIYLFLHTSVTFLL